MSWMQAYIVTGDRHAGEQWSDLIKTELTSRFWGTTHFLIIHGDADGIDTIAKDVCQVGNIPQLAMPYIKSEGLAGGPIRNREMLNVLLSLQRVGYTIGVLAFHHNIKSSKGTKNMEEIARLRGVDTRVFDSPHKQLPVW